MSRESRRKQKKERQRRKQAERDARRTLKEMLKQAQEQAAAADARIAEQMRIDAKARKDQAAVYNRYLLRIQNKAAADLKAMQDKHAQDEAARIKREEIARMQREAAERMAIQEQKIGASNRARAAAGATGLQIQPAAGGSGVGGTPQFKRRKDQFNVSGSYGGLSTIKSGTINI